jgi:O-antigen/teichoic acid export membrane protein
MTDQNNQNIELNGEFKNTITAATKRKRNLSLAVITSIISKVANTAVQVLAMPIALHALGVSRFGVYTTLAAAIGWLGLSSVGIGPGLTRKIAEAAAKEDIYLEKQLTSSAFFFMLSIVLPLISFAFILIWIGNPILLFGLKYLPYLHEIREGLSALLVMFAIRMMLSIGEAAQMGYQEQYIINAWGAAGNLLCLVSLLFVTHYLPTVLGIILAVNGASTFTRLLNYLNLIFRKRPHLIPVFQSFNKSVLKGVIGTGIAFSLVQLSGILSYDLSIIISGRIIGPAASARVGIMMQAVTLGMGLVAMISQPLWPAITDAATRGEKEWIYNAYKRAIKMMMAYACLVGCVLGLGGRILVFYWFGPKVVPPFWLHFLFGIDFILEVWFHIHYIFLMGLGRIRKASILILTRSLVTFPLAIFSISHFGIAGAAFALVLPMLLLVSWTMPREFKIALNRIG